MDEHEVRDSADEVLKPILGPVGSLSSGVRARADHEGEDAVYVTVHFRPDADVTTGKTHIDASEAMFDALHRRGERRFADLKHDDPGPAGSDPTSAVE